MIEELRIRDLGVIEDALLELGPGFTAITGETGAGKTMVLTGLSLLFGGKSDTSRIRAGAPKAHIDGVLALTGSLKQRLDDLEADYDDGAVIISRTVAADGGRGRAVVGGRPLPLAVLQDIAEDVVAIHGQADQRRLLQSATQRAVVDRFSGSPGVQALLNYRQAWQRWTAATQALQEFEQNSSALKAEALALQAALDEISTVNPVEAEDERLKEEASRLSHSESLRATAAQAHLLITQDDSDVVSVLAQARRVLEHHSDIDPRLGEFASALKEPIAVISELVTDLASYIDSIDGDPSRLAWVEQRRSELNALTRKLGRSIDDILQWQPEATMRLAAIIDDGSLQQRLADEVTASHAELLDCGRQLTSVRSATAIDIARKVTVELRALAMGDAVLHIDINPTDIGPSGADEVVFSLENAAGQRVPIGKGASGGELSRIMLALEVVVAQTNPVPVMVFDEVDAGVGGKSAVEVGRRLCRLAAHTQVLVVTHLPQVAAFADRHITVTKEEQRSAVRVLTDEQRVGETARMLAGLEQSDAAQAHAQELLALAQAERDARYAAAHPPH